MRIIFYLFTGLFLLWAGSSFSQENEKGLSAFAPNAYVELGGNGGVISLNYDQRFSKKNNALGGRIGVGVDYKSGGHGAGEFPLTVPVSLNYLFGRKSSFLEAGAGITFGELYFEGNKRESNCFVPSLGYRYQPADRGFSFRVMATPFIGNEVYFSGGVSFGLRF